MNLYYAQYRYLVEGRLEYTFTASLEPIQAPLNPPPGHFTPVDEPPPLVARIAKTLLSLGGTQVAGIPAMEDLTDVDLAAISNGRAISGEGHVMRKMRACRCHDNVAYLSLDRPTFTPMTGWGLTGDDGTWRRHSWLVNRQGKVVETTVPRDLYFGVEVPRGHYWLDQWGALWENVPAEGLLDDPEQARYWEEDEAARKRYLEAVRDWAAHGHTEDFSYISEDATYEALDAAGANVYELDAADFLFVHLERLYRDRVIDRKTMRALSGWAYYLFVEARQEEVEV